MSGRKSGKRWGAMRNGVVGDSEGAHEVLVGYLELPKCERRVAAIKRMVASKGLEVVERRKNWWAEVAVKLRWGHEEDFVALRKLGPTLDKIDDLLASA